MWSSSVYPSCSETVAPRPDRIRGAETAANPESDIVRLHPSQRLETPTIASSVPSGGGRPPAHRSGSRKPGKQLGAELLHSLGRRVPLFLDSGRSERRLGRTLRWSIFWVNKRPSRIGSREATLVFQRRCLAIALTPRRAQTSNTLRRQIEPGTRNDSVPDTCSRCDLDVFGWRSLSVSDSKPRASEPTNTRALASGGQPNSCGGVNGRHACEK